LAAAGLQCATPWPVLIRNRHGLRNLTPLFVSLYPAANLFGDAPRKYSEASVRARDSSLASWTTRAFVRAVVASQKPLLHTLGAMKRPWMLQRPHASTSPASSQTTHQHHKLSPYTRRRAVHISRTFTSLRTSRRQTLGTIRAGRQARIHISPSGHRCTYRCPGRFLCSEPAALDGWREACE
jgi:hypothetical protein